MKDAEQFEGLLNGQSVLPQVMDALPHAIYWKNRELIYQGCNQAFARLAGVVAPAAVVGMNELDLPRSAFEIERKRELEERVVRDGVHPESALEAWPGAEGQTCYWEARRFPLRDPAGMTTGLVGVLEGVAGEDRAAGNLAENCRLAITAIADGVILTDERGSITFMNPAAERIIGISVDAALGCQIDRLYVTREPGSNATRRSVYDRLRRSGQASFSPHLYLKIEYLNYNDDGPAPYSISESAAPIFDGTGRFNGIAVVFRDITIQRNEDERRRHSVRLESLGQLAGGIAHDFNNMLGGIMAATDLLRSQIPKRSEHFELVSVISNTSNRARDLVAKLLSFSRRGMKRSELIDAHNLIRNVLTILAGSIDKRIEIVSELNAAEVTLKGDSAELESALLNIGINARDAMPAGGVLRLATAQVHLSDDSSDGDQLVSLPPGTYLEVVIEDTGCGIEAELLPRIFDPFFTTKPHGVGTGLGLAAAYGAVKEHDGSIRVDSTPGEGSRFTILLPVTDEVAVVEERSSAIDHVGHGTILVADDEPALRMTTELMLQQMGYAVRLTANGKECVDAYKADPDGVRAVILDFTMPVMNGQECMEALLAINPDLKVLLTSGYAPDGRIAEMKDAGLCSFLSKPFRYHELAAALDKILS